MSVEHEGCSQKSEAAADRIRQLYQSLLDQQWTNRKGDTQQIGIRDILVVSLITSIQIFWVALARGGSGWHRR